MLGRLKPLVSPPAGGTLHLLRRFGVADPTITDGAIAEADL